MGIFDRFRRKEEPKPEIKQLDDNILSQEESLSKIAISLSKSVNPKEVFIRGLIQGMATVIGATLVAGLLLGLLSAILDRAENVPIVDDLIERTNIREIVNPDN